jgi:hypothetical protein
MGAIGHELPSLVRMPWSHPLFSPSRMSLLNWTSPGVRKPGEAPIKVIEASVVSIRYKFASKVPHKRPSGVNAISRNVTGEYPMSRAWQASTST